MTVKRGKIIKKTFKIALWFTGVLTVLLLSFYLAFQTSWVQTFVVRQVTNQLSQKLHTKISVQRVDISFFNKVILRGVCVEDQQADTLLYIEDVTAIIDRLKWRKQLIDLSSVNLRGTEINVAIDENHLPNYSFLLDSLRSNRVNKDPELWGISCQNFQFDEARVEYSYFKQDTPSTIDLRNIHLDVSNLQLSEDSIYFRINELMFNDHKNFSLDRLSTEFTSSHNLIKLRNLQVLTPNSVVTKANFTFDQTQLKEGSDFKDSYVDLDLKDSEIDLADVASFVPELSGMNQKIDISGHIFGTISELKAKNLHLKTGRNTELTCDLYTNGLPNLDETYIQMDLYNSVLDFNDLAQVRLPNSAKSQYPTFNKTFLEAGLVHYDGNFTGFISDFVSYGTFRSDFGEIQTDLSFRPSDSNSLNIQGHLNTVNFNLGQFVQSDKVGQLTFAGQINGQYKHQIKSLDAEIIGQIDSIDFENYRYKNITLDGFYRKNKFAGDLAVNDENLQFQFRGDVEIAQDSSRFNFEMDLNRANLRALNLDRRNSTSELAMHVIANFTGDNIDTMNGLVEFDSGEYFNDNDTIKLNSLTINTSSADKNVLELTSDFLDARIEGQYSFRTLKNSIENLIATYLPTSRAEKHELNGRNNFSLNVQIKNAEPVLKTFYPDLKISSGYLSADYNESQPNLDLYAEIDDIQLKALHLQGYSISARADETLDFKTRIEQVSFGQKQNLYNLAVLASAKDDVIDTKLLWNNYDILTYSGLLEAKVQFSERNHNKAHADIKIEPGRIYVADSLWTIHPSALTIDSSRVEIDNFLISNDNQYLSLNGVISKDPEDKIDIRANNFKLENLNRFAKGPNAFSGDLHGTVSLLNVYNRPLFLSDIELEDFYFNDLRVGNITLKSAWDSKSEGIQAELIADNDTRQTLYGYGAYYPTSDSLDFTVDADGFSLTILNTVLKGNFQNVHGDATGEIKVGGGLKKVLLDGDILGTNAGLALSQLQVSYYFTDTVKFRSDSIIFDHITINDFEGNTGVFNGSIRHDNFQNMDYDLSVLSNNLQVINTTPSVNEKFYGKAFANGRVIITGHGRTVNISGTARTLPKTAINIAMDSGYEAQTYDFIRFVNHNEAGEEENSAPPEPQEKSQVNMSFDLDVTPDARFQLIYDSQIGDMIRAQGLGDLQVKIDPDFNIELYGDFSVERGDYLFTLKNVINKKFEIERGGKVQWSGDPYNAIISLNAIYRLKASLNELFAGSNENYDYMQRVPVNCIIKLEDQLSNPKINFAIEFPSVEDRIKEEVKQYMNTEEDMNKQMLSLLVLGQFYTPEYLRGSYEAQNPNLVGATASELFSNQLSNWLSQISNDFDIGVNYRPGNQITDDEIELALSTQIFNDRVTINGNISNNANQTGTTTTNNSSAFVGDFDVNVKLTNNGKLQLKAYNHSNNNIIYETSPYKQGIGISYRENYDTFEELWQKFLRIFRSDKNK